MPDGSFSLLGDGASGSKDNAEPSARGSPSFDFGAISPADSVGGSSGGSGARDSRGDSFDPELHSAPDKFNADGSFRRKRGRKSGGGSSTGRASSKGSASVASIEKSLVGIHAILAASTGFEDLRLSEPDESKPLAEAVHECAKHFDIPAIDPKYLAVFGLVVTAGRVYAPKVALIGMELKKRKAEKGESKVLKFRPRPVEAGQSQPEPAFKAEPFDPSKLSDYLEPGA